MIDYSHKATPFTRIYWDFLMQDREIDIMIRSYLSRYHDKHYKGEERIEVFLDREMPILKDQVKRMALQMNIMWSIWSLVMMPEEEIQEPAFYISSAKLRYEMYLFQKVKFQI